jgi:hypothetical protein
MGLGVVEILIFLVMLVGGTVFWIWMIIDCASYEPSGADKIVWILIILFGNIIGAGIYFLVRRPRRREGLEINS